jgi:hypothetical protein
MRTLTVALTAALLALPAVAADRVTLPPQLLGTWCPVPSKRVGSATFYERGDCYHNNDGASAPSASSGCRERWRCRQRENPPAT